jgi:hypothetical protein
MASYEVDIKYTGEVVIWVDANNPSEAMEIAKKQFEDFNEVDSLGVTEYTIQDVKGIQ